MVFQNRGRLSSMKCILIVVCVCDVCCTSEMHCQLVKVYGVCVIPWKQADMVHGFHQWQDRWQIVTRALSMPTTDDAWRTDTFSCSRCQRARHSLGSAQNCLGPTGLQRSMCTLCAKESHRWWQCSLYGTEWAYLISIGHVALIKENCFGAETWLITQNLKPEKWCVMEKLSSPSSKENGSIVPRYT